MIFIFKSACFNIHSQYCHMAEQDTVDLSPRDRITQEGQLLGSVPGTGKHTSDVGEAS